MDVDVLLKNPVFAEVIRELAAYSAPASIVCFIAPVVVVYVTSVWLKKVESLSCVVIGRKRVLGLIRA